MEIRAPPPYSGQEKGVQKSMIAIPSSAEGESRRGCGGKKNKLARSRSGEGFKHGRDPRGKRGWGEIVLLRGKKASRRSVKKKKTRLIFEFRQKKMECLMQSAEKTKDKRTTLVKKGLCKAERKSVSTAYLKKKPPIPPEFGGPLKRGGRQKAGQKRES